MQGVRVAASVAVAKSGSYSVSLAPGTYTVVVSRQQPGIGPWLEPGTVRLTSGSARKVDFRIDTGIR